MIKNISLGLEKRQLARQLGHCGLAFLSGIYLVTTELREPPTMLMNKIKSQPNECFNDPSHNLYFCADSAHFKFAKGSLKKAEADLNSQLADSNKNYIQISFSQELRAGGPLSKTYTLEAAKVRKLSVKQRQELLISLFMAFSARREEKQATIPIYNMSAWVISDHFGDWTGAQAAFKCSFNYENKFKLTQACMPWVIEGSKFTSYSYGNIPPEVYNIFLHLTGYQISPKNYLGSPMAFQLDGKTQTIPIISTKAGLTIQTFLKEDNKLNKSSAGYNHNEI